LTAQRAQNESGQTTALDALSKKNAELAAAAEAAQKNWMRPPARYRCRLPR
jgi:colicin import membrane protein